LDLAGGLARPRAKTRPTTERTKANLPGKYA
jgi:hypothetical protein